METDGESLAEQRKKDAMKRREERNAARQKQLILELQEDKVDWRKVEAFMLGENLNPNYMERGTNVCTHHMAAFEGESEILRWCLREKADVNAVTSLGRSVLHYACNGNQPRCIRMLLESEADANMRTLAQMTPLHFCCQYNSYEAVMVLLYEAKQTIDIDAENAKRQIPETLAKDRKIFRAVKKYRSNLDERRRADLLEQCLRRLFKLFDRNGDEWILPEEWADTQALIAQHFESLSDDAIDEVFQAADKNKDGRVDWKEFREGHKELMDALGVPFREVLNRLNDIETSIQKERLRIEGEKGSGEAPDRTSPVVSLRAKELALRRAQGGDSARRPIEPSSTLPLPRKLAWSGEEQATGEN